MLVMMMPVSTVQMTRLWDNLINQNGGDRQEYCNLKTEAYYIIVPDNTQKNLDILKQITWGCQWPIGQKHLTEN